MLQSYHKQQNLFDYNKSSAFKLFSTSIHSVPAVKYIKINNTFGSDSKVYQSVYTGKTKNNLKMMNLDTWIFTTLVEIPANRG